MILLHIKYAIIFFFSSEKIAVQYNTVQKKTGSTRK